MVFHGFPDFALRAMSDPRNLTGTVPENFRIIENFKNITLQRTKNYWNPFSIEKVMSAQSCAHFGCGDFFLKRVGLLAKRRKFPLLESEKCIFIYRGLILGVRTPYLVCVEYWIVLFSHKI